MITSEAHFLDCGYEKEENLVTLSRFEFVTLSADDHVEVADEDEQPKRRRRCRGKNSNNQSRYLLLYHKTETKLEDVGHQLWRGSYLLADFLFFQHQELEKVKIFELGCGIGMIGVLLKHVLTNHKGATITDYKESVLELVNRNITANKHLKQNDNADNDDDATCTVTTQLLDWTTTLSDAANVIAASDSSSSSAVGGAGACPTLFLAADVIYDDALTESLFNVLRRLVSIHTVISKYPPSSLISRFTYAHNLNRMAKVGDKVWISLELRFNFQVDELSVCAHGYKKFLQCVHSPPTSTSSSSPSSASMPSLSSSSSTTRTFGEVNFQGRRLDLLFPQRFQSYHRTKELELWEIIVY